VQRILKRGGKEGVRVTLKSSFNVCNLTPFQTAHMGGGISVCI